VRVSRQVTKGARVVAWWTGGVDCR
jgi:hypothetical protein